MHLADTSVGIIGESAIVGGGIPLATGAGLSAIVRGTDQVSLSFFGDGAANQGVLYECLNMAAIWKLPVIFFCENNLYAATTPMLSTHAQPDIARRADGFAIPGVIVDGQALNAVHEATCVAVARARRGEGPTLIEVKTDRYLGHFQGDPETYRPKGETAGLRKNDPIPRLAEHLRRAGLLDDAADQALRQRVSARITEAYDYGRSSPYPKPEDALLHVFC